MSVEEQVTDDYEIRYNRHVHNGTVDADRFDQNQLDKNEIRNDQNTKKPPSE